MVAGEARRSKHRSRRAVRGCLRCCYGEHLLTSRAHEVIGSVDFPFGGLVHTVRTLWTPVAARYDRLLAYAYEIDLKISHRSGHDVSARHYHVFHPKQQCERNRECAEWRESHA